MALNTTRSIFWSLSARFSFNTSSTGREIADMAERGQNLIGGAQIFVDRLGFRRRLDNDDIHVIPMAYGKNKGRFRETRVGSFVPNMGGEGPPVKSTDVEGGAEGCKVLSKKL